MRRMIGLVLGLALVLGLIVSTQASAAATVTKFQGDFAYALFDSRDSCIGTAAYVDAYKSKSMSSYPPASKDGYAFAYVEVWQWDSCTHTPIFDSVAYAPISWNALNVTANARSAKLKTALSAHDNITGQTRRIDVDLTWKVEGDAYPYKDSFHNQSPSTIVNVQIKNALAYGTATGRIAVDKVNYTLYRSVSAAAQTNATGTVTITKK